jgi:hypothetical protein
MLQFIFCAKDSQKFSVFVGQTFGEARAWVRHVLFAN